MQAHHSQVLGEHHLAQSHEGTSQAPQTSQAEVLNHHLAEWQELTLGTPCLKTLIPRLNAPNLGPGGIYMADQNNKGLFSKKKRSDG